MKVLIAEDNPTFREMFRDFILLHYPGSQVTVVQNGKAAERVLGEALFDLLLTDLNMPGGNGEDLVYKIRYGEISKEPSVVDIPIILITQPPEDAVLPVNGAMGSIVDFEALADLINHAVKGR